jgi:glycosyltransferase involved in cell wall biosynthesis
MTVIHPWQTKGPFLKRRKVTIGIVQRGDYEGKGFFFMLELLNDAGPLLRDWLHFVFVGKGWDEVVERYRKLGIEVTYIKKESSHVYYGCYQKMDYLLIPSLWEGGPISLMQAYSQSVPIIAADVGWVPDHFAEEPWMMFPPGDRKALLDILERICSESAARRAVAEKFSYSDYAAKLLSVVEKLRKTQT